MRRERLASWHVIKIFQTNLSTKTQSAIIWVWKSKMLDLSSHIIVVTTFDWLMPRANDKFYVCVHHNHSDYCFVIWMNEWMFILNLLLFLFKKKLICGQHTYSKSFFLCENFSFDSFLCVIYVNWYSLLLFFLIRNN